MATALAGVNMTAVIITDIICLTIIVLGVIGRGGKKK